MKKKVKGELRKGCKNLFKLSWAMKKGYMIKKLLARDRLKAVMHHECAERASKAVMFDKDKNKTIKNEQEEEEERPFKICHL
jgi:hypothetical protein